jgi:secondary thiamine-phosphate synthase enzyme
MEVINIKTKIKTDLIEITGEIKKALINMQATDCTLHVFCPHTTAGLTINENADPDVKDDIIKALNALGIEKLNYKHAEGNSPAHVKSSLTGVSVFIIIKNGKPLLGTWQGIFFAEFDGPRNRKVYLSKI